MICQSRPHALTLALCALAALGALLFCLVLTPVPALALAEGRVYELVSPVYKGGYGVNALGAVAPGGESVAFDSLGAFNGDPANEIVNNYYIAHRAPSGWSTAPATVPAAGWPKGEVYDFSATLESSLSEAKPGSGSHEGASLDGVEDEYLLHRLVEPDVAANFEIIGEPLKALDEKPFIGLAYAGASPDFSHVIFNDNYEPSEQLLSEATKTDSTLYDLGGNSGGGSPLRLVGLNNKGKVFDPLCHVSLGPVAASGGKASEFNAVAADGDEIFFTPNGTGECSQQLYVRLGGSRTLELSRPLESSKPFGGCVGKGVRGEVPCEGSETRAPAEFQGASEDGSKVFFTTTQPLVPGDTDVSNNLYMATIGCPGGGGEACEAAHREVTSLVAVSRDSTGPAEVQDTVTMASDGSRVYFVARGVLTDEPGPEGRVPLEGADNLYVYTVNPGSSGGPGGSGTTAFIGDLCSGPVLSGGVEDTRCPADLETGIEPKNKNDTSLWDTPQPEAQVNGCSGATATCEPGRFLVFSSYAQLAAGDTDNAKDVYRYDAATGALVRVSVGEGGYDANGNCDEGGGETTCDATIARNLEFDKVSYQHDLGTRAISEDGSRIVLTTSEALSPAAVNRLANVYEWHQPPGSGEGVVSLISSGSSDEPVEHAVISDTGNDVFFLTTQGLVPQDTDGQADIYDARIEGGFPPAVAEPEPCEGDACQGPLTNPAPLLVPGSVSQAPGGNFPAPAPVVAVTPKQVTPRCAKGKKLSRGACVKAKTKVKQKTKAKKANKAKNAKRAGTDRGGRS